MNDFYDLVRWHGRPARFFESLRAGRPCPLEEAEGRRCQP